MVSTATMEWRGTKERSARALLGHGLLCALAFLATLLRSGRWPFAVVVPASLISLVRIRRLPSELDRPG